MADPTSLEVAVAVMNGIFLSHKGDDEKLTKQEFLNLVKEEMPHFKDQDLSQIFAGVDLNSDGFVDFQEFTMLVAIVAMQFNELLKEMNQKQKPL